MKSPQFPVTEWWVKGNYRGHGRHTHNANTLDSFVAFGFIKSWSHRADQVKKPDGTSFSEEHWLLTDDDGNTRDYKTRQVETLIENFCDQHGIVWRPVVYVTTPNQQRMVYDEVLAWMRDRQRYVCGKVY
ncbi:hypothetical protein V6U81_04435 [Micromonospora sp. CPCC 205711]|uniref:hypothetical protein n=1 Tax=Micromonospora sp. CPCC 205547 TaxID=3122400 RepID=UPI002FEF2B69